MAITKDHQYFVNQDLVAGDAALVALFQKACASGSCPNLVVMGDTAAQHGWIVHVVDLAKQQGITKFALNVQGGE